MAEFRTPQGHTLLLPEGCVSIGADPANDVPVAAHLGLAPIHFRLQPWEGGHFLEDAGSGLGTLVNGHPVNWKPLTHGDVITAGELEVVYAQKASGKTHAVPVVAAPEAQPQAATLTPPPGFSPAPFALVLSHSPVPTCLAGQKPLEVNPVLPPPAWLPEDLLPEAYRQARAPHCETPVPPAPVLNEAESGPFPAARPRRATRRLQIAALCGVLAWAGHFAWQKGHLTSFLQALRNSSSGSVDYPGPSIHEATPRPSRLPTQ